MSTADFAEVKQRFEVFVETSISLHYTSPRFLSLTISASEFARKDRMRAFDYSSKKLQNLAAALSPTNIRFGGTYADFLHFDPNGSDSLLPSGWSQEEEDVFDSGFFTTQLDRKRVNFTLPGSRWDNMTRFCDKVGWDIMWDFNLFYWKDGLWDPTNAKTFLKYSAARGVRMPSFQLGNEPNSFQHNFNFSIEPDVLVKDFNILRDLIAEFPQYDASGIYGPENTNLDRHGSSRQYLSRFLAAGGCDAVTEIGLHHYYLDGRTATVSDFLNPEVLDTLKLQLDYAYNITWGTCRLRKPIRLTETSSAFGGGAEGLSNGYVAGFLWLDKLGLSAKHGVTHLFRQTFFGGRYSLIDMKLNPNPDFFLTLLYKRLIEGPVFKVITSGFSPMMRLYAHCASKRYYNFPDGTLVVYYLNLGTETVSLSMEEYQNAELLLYSLTPGDSLGMKSKKVKLNGRLLEMNGAELPLMKPRSHTGDIPVEQQSFGFIVIPSAEVPLCKVYHRSYPTKRKDGK
ncbi:heparanase [Plakobranchus ocellatus]|uniref:Heparanase n=1 Tax=Plakobranchus ocellatus TaxID=259542 RepID=A0AAV4ALP8_9GAST|nr:heparanase [Plakobranchus ocellatus]